MEYFDKVIELINNVGVPIAFCIYFAWRDMKFMQKLDSTLDVIKNYIAKGEK